MWFRPMPLILIKDEDLIYHGKTLSVRYEEGRLRAIHATMCISEYRSRLRRPASPENPDNSSSPQVRV
ncbi:hypothetical protein FOQG_17961 [Fusarium oxysporum f. sp. raphani 54005]|uniref:Uncharacterized protein n=1 Tax=Fusarium oxysporum f. sp. raphani 54005 TaxID=1089458 RepID=X0B5D3_FUSOX|nr:hypothetical protein FOQG_17961 [Fusarium oxysporum f. sp. raphani 54005]